MKAHLCIKERRAFLNSLELDLPNNIYSNIPISTKIKILINKVYLNILNSIRIKIFMNNIYLFFRSFEGIFKCPNYIVCALFRTPF